jgi:tRNA A37 threonylcarbamoyladenosine modification protein TsaB
MVKNIKFFIVNINNETFFMIDNDKDVKNFSFKGHLSDQLHLRFKQFLDLYKININEIGSIYVCRGPGSFTSLRMIILFAKTLCLCLGARLYSANVFEIFLPNIKEEKYNMVLVSKKKTYYLADCSRDSHFCSYRLAEEDEVLNRKGFFIGNSELKDFVNISINDIKIIYDIFKEEDVYNFEPEYGVDLNVKIWNR